MCSDINDSSGRTGLVVCRNCFLRMAILSDRSVKLSGVQGYFLGVSGRMTMVKLYVYDVTQGMARQMAPILLGRPLDGVWHTGIMAYGHEYFFGGGGIDYCLPSGTILGHPTEVVDLGETEIPQDVFHDYLFELSTSRFHGSAYHLLNHNCNTFSDEVAQFLTGRGIPEHIVNLPHEILATPFGQMIRPFIDSMMMQVATGADVHHIGPPETQMPILPTDQLTTASTGLPPATNASHSSSFAATQSPIQPTPSDPVGNDDLKDTASNKDDIDLD